jgi:serine/threonine protein kinase
VRDNAYVRLGPYILEDSPRKEGGQAFIYFGRDRRSGTKVALKIARPSDWSLRRMKREIAVQSTLDHPNILPIIGHDGERRWYATLEATASLDDIGPFAKRDWTRFRVGLLGIASAVRYAHEAGYIHRDLSPGNVLIFPDRWVVSDWGFVYERPQSGPRLTQPLERFGTPDFMAPEMVTDPMNVTTAADVFSIGRIAVWGTGLKPRETGPDDDGLVSWWRRFIDGTTPYDPQERWTMHDVVTHLRAKPVVLPNAAFETPASRTPAEACPQCGSTRGRDAAGRCLSCHTLSPY